MDGDGLTAAIFADNRPRALAALVRSFRNLDMAEDLYQEACLRAAERWRRDGAPRDPTAWLITVARRAGLDRLRKSRRLSSLDAETALEAQAPDGDTQAEVAEAIDRTEYKDDVLRLMFMCCHPELRTHEQLALALKVVVGFSVEEIARAFVVTPDTMQRRLSRAKARAAVVAAKLHTPGLAERAERLAAVQTMIYLLFNEGYTAASGDEHIRHALCDEAIRLARLLLELFPAQAELMGLLALCLLQHCRTRARIDGDGRLISLEDQDRWLWDRAKIAEGRMLVEKALMKGRPGPLQVQAAIAAVHCAAGCAEDTDWAEIERLYGALEVLAPGPVVSLNRAVAIGKVRGPAEALAKLAPLGEDLDRYRPYHSVRAALLEESGDIGAAIAALEAALSCGPTRQETAYLTGKITTLKESTGRCQVSLAADVSVATIAEGDLPVPHDPHLAELMRNALVARPGITEKKMFGGYCWMLNGNMLCGVEVGRFMFRVGKELEAEALRRPGASPMDITGKPMRGIIWVDADEAIDAGLDAWVGFSARFVGSLPPK